MLRVRFFRVRPGSSVRCGRGWRRWPAAGRRPWRPWPPSRFVTRPPVLETAEGPILVCAIEAEDLALVDRAFESSSFAIDHEHRRIMDEALIEPFPSEALLDLRP